MTVTVKENMDPEKLLQDPKLVIEEPALRPQKPRTGGDATALSPDEMLRRALKNLKKAIRQHMHSRGQMPILQTQLSHLVYKLEKRPEPIMTVDKKNQNSRQQGKEQYKKKTIR